MSFLATKWAFTWAAARPRTLPASARQQLQHLKEAVQIVDWWTSIAVSGNKTNVILLCAQNYWHDEKGKNRKLPQVPLKLSCRSEGYSAVVFSSKSTHPDFSQVSLLRKSYIQLIFWTGWKWEITPSCGAQSSHLQCGLTWLPIPNSPKPKTHFAQVYTQVCFFFISDISHKFIPDCTWWFHFCEMVWGNSQVESHGILSLQCHEKMFSTCQH